MRKRSSRSTAKTIDRRCQLAPKPTTKEERRKMALNRALFIAIFVAMEWLMIV